MLTHEAHKPLARPNYPGHRALPPLPLSSSSHLNSASPSRRTLAAPPPDPPPPPRSSSAAGAAAAAASAKMSGGFFRGTSADQDTRFSNKQAKLLKSQKFPSELDHLVDMTKVKMDVMKPWIATRATELLGFEDEVLINFIYGLLDEKVADGKKIQIQLTGFMEKNTVKFMKELWNLLLSAQQNASGVPQQFLDAKEAEIQLKKAEEDRIAQEIQKKREKDGRDLELEKYKTDGDAGNSRDRDPLGPALNNRADAEEEKQSVSKHNSRTKNREGRRSRSISLSPRGRQRSISPRRRSPSPSRNSFSFQRQQRSTRRSISPRRSVSPRRRSPRSTTLMSRRRSPFSRRSPSELRHRSPSPRWRSHIRRKSPFGRRRSPSPNHRRSPVRAPRSPSPARRRSPRRRLSTERNWSPSPLRRRPRSPSPGRRRRQSPSPGRRKPRSRSPGRRRSPSPLRSPHLRSPKRHRRSPVSPKTRSANRRVSPQRMRNTSPHSSSPNCSHRSLSIDIDKGRNGVPSNNDGDVLQRNLEGKSLDDRNATEMSVHRSSDSGQHKLPKSLSSPNKPERNSTHDSLKSPGRHFPRQDSLGTSGDEEEGSRARENVRKANSSRRKIMDLKSDVDLKNGHGSSPGEKSPSRSPQSGKNNQKKHEIQLSESSEDERDGRRMKRRTDSPDDSLGKHLSPNRAGKQNSNLKDVMNDDHAMKGSRDAIAVKKYSDKVDEDSDGSPLGKLKKRAHGNSHIDSGSSGSEESGKHRSHSEKRKHKKAHKHKRHYDDSSDESGSEADNKESKRRRKEEKRLRKEERRRRREERHRRRADRQSSKQKLKPGDTVSSDLEKDRESDSDGDVRKKGSYAGREESDQQQLEIELREKALESLRAKKAINN